MFLILSCVKIRGCESILSSYFDGRGAGLDTAASSAMSISKDG